MKISDKQLAELQRLYRDVLGIRITKSDALTQGLALVRLIKSLRSTKYVNEQEDDKEQTLQR